MRYIAQLVEHWTFNPQALGSNPSVPNYKSMIVAKNVNYILIGNNCKVCVEELKNSMKPVASCATNAQAVLQNSIVYRDSALVKKARENILNYHGGRK